MYQHTLRLSILALAVHATLAAADPAADSSYFTDVQRSYVEDATSDGVAQVNFITCLMSSMRPDALVNQGDYVALVDATKCDTRAQAEGRGNDFYTARVNSTRASNDEPMIAKIWLDDEQDGEKATIFVHLSATEAPSAANPYGQFRLDYCGLAEGATECIMNGYLEADDTGLRYFEVEAPEDDGDEPRTKAVQLNSVGTTSGSGRMLADDEASPFDFAYDSTLFRRKRGSDDQCFTRDASDPETGMSVWRYGLYDSDTGARVTRNSGFPIEYTSAGVTHHGYLGYYGLSLPASALATLSSGDTVQKVDYESDDEPTKTDYTVVRAEGKLKKLTRKVRSLREIDKVKFDTYVGHDGATLFAGATAYTNYELYWNEATGAFRATAFMACDASGCTKQSLPTEQEVDVAYWQAYNGVFGYSNSLGGELFIALNGAASVADSASVDVVYRVEDLVYPSQMPETLYCLRDCPTSASLSSYFTEASLDESPFVTGTYNNFSPVSHGSQVTYHANPAAAVLEDAADQPVTFADAEAMQSSQYSHGVRTGVLFTDLAAAECSEGSGTYCETKAGEQEVYYRWETGAGSYNQFAAVKDSNDTFVEFDAPLQVNYSVPDEEAYGEYAGQQLVLQYGGFGDLWGIPGHCVSRATNAVVSCEGEDSRYVASFTIPFNATQGQVVSGADTYLVKWLEREIRFAPKALSVCESAGLELPENVSLPTSAGLQNPSDPASAAYIGPKPTISAAPRVVDGEVKY
ncbi:MAG TPA: hypothetical protein VGE08_00810 [Steroidobacter sp.]|uniref:hypothetical protein n=1 Tax=Steroidobacter sp. TaxID=1978227 RepID=UPI002ED86043